MATDEEAIAPDSSGTQKAPVEVVTMNGFSIVRLCDPDEGTLNTTVECRFRVKAPEGVKCEIVVEFDAEAMRMIEQRKRHCLSQDSPFWIGCAERSLATYLWEKDQCPPEGRLILTDLCLDDLNVALRWKDD